MASRFFRIGSPVIVAGLGLSGRAAVRYFLREGLPVVAWDEMALSEAVRAELPPSLTVIEAPFDPAVFASAAAIVVSPGIPTSHPAMQAALLAGVPRLNEAGLALERLTLPIVAVTGSSGKTTTSTLIAAMLDRSGRRAYLGGNVGRPLLDLLDPAIGPSFDVVVAELSSFQLEVASPFAPKVAVLTPFHEDHLDRHGSVEAYFAAKASLFRWLEDDGVAVMGLHHRSHAEFSRLVRGQVLWYWPRGAASAGQLGTGILGAAAEATTLTVRTAESERTLAFRGPAFSTGANRENAAAAALAALAMGGTFEGVQAVLNDFRGLPHRLEFVASQADVAFVNDSKATNTVATAGALRSFRPKSVVLLAGGRNKGLDPRELLPLVKDRCRAVVAFGEAGPVFANAFCGHVAVELVGDFSQAVEKARSLAVAGDTVLLSPACASLDAFKSYADRGDRFREIVLSRNLI